MIVKKELYNALRKKFPKQVLTFDELPAGMEKGVEFLMIYKEGKRINEIDIRLLDFKDMYNGFTVIENGKGNYVIKFVLTYHGIYKVHDVNTFKVVNHKAPENRTKKDKKEAGAKRQSLQDLTDRIANFVITRRGEIDSEVEEYNQKREKEKDKSIEVVEKYTGLYLEEGTIKTKEYGGRKLEIVGKIKEELENKGTKEIEDEVERFLVDGGLLSRVAYSNKYLLVHILY